MMLAPSTASFAQSTDYDDEIVIEKKDGKEEIIEVPEGMMINIDSLLNDYKAKSYLTPDEGCNFSDVNPAYEQEIYVDRLRRLPTAIEMPWNEVVQKFIDRYAARDRRSVSYMLGAANFYFPLFEQALEVYNLPLELKYLPVIESAFKTKAVSSVGATGLWQFMLPTAKRYGLRVTTMIDERCDPLKASYAAAHYLSDLYGIYGDWNLVIAAYNCGPENVNKAIHRAGGVKDYWQIYPFLPAETRGYVPAFIAANYIMTYYCEHNICPMRTTLPLQTDTIMLYRDVHFKQISEVLGISMDELRTLNPQYRRDIVTGYSEPTDLRLPIDYINAYIDRENEILTYDVGSLMKRSEVEVATKASARAARQVKVDDDDDESYSPSESKRSSSKSKREDRRSSKKSKKEKKSKRGGGEKTVTIKEGDNLGAIARRNHTTVEKLQRLNGLKGTNIRAGKKLKVK